jgi:hypothetical protein
VTHYRNVGRPVADEVEIVLRPDGINAASRKTNGRAGGEESKIQKSSMTIQEAINKAEAAGYVPNAFTTSNAFLDPSFWQCLGKGLGNKDEMRCESPHCKSIQCEYAGYKDPHRMFPVVYGDYLGRRKGRRVLCNPSMTQKMRLLEYTASKNGEWVSKRDYQVVLQFSQSGRAINTILKGRKDFYDKWLASKGWVFEQRMKEDGKRMASLGPTSGDGRTLG